MQKFDALYLVLPGRVANAFIQGDLSHLDFCVFAMIQYQNTPFGGGCFETNKELAVMCDTTPSRVASAVRRLLKRGFIYSKIEYERTRMDGGANVISHEIFKDGKRLLCTAEGFRNAK